ncbi:alpha/beta fold hydrolase [Leucobacter sp. M11]|uniref:alpha/beta fold hydrolase n=1 Tax=Leucobacter sp. M11 TaxID=2993565 RepID=UPI002D7E81CF|nr:alpha/beta hydrolase [Leucobacter sp. M11]MEB4613738.1 alpha/beta hydrolase [Leucobacter sp. M11]
MAFKTPDLRYRPNSTVDLGGECAVYTELYDRATEPVVVFLNNFYIVAPMWRGYLGRVIDQHSVLLYDLENQGGSSVVEEPSIDSHAETLHALLQAIGKSRVILVGTSASCVIATRYAELHPESVVGLLLIGPSMTPSADPIRKATERALMNSLRLGGIEALWDHLYSFVFSVSTMNKLGASGYLGLRSAFMALHRQDPMLANMRSAAVSSTSFHSLLSLPIPTQVTVGDQDMLWQGEQIEEARAAFTAPGHSIRVLEGLGHLPYLEDAERFQDVVLDFVSYLLNRENPSPSTLGGAIGPSTEDVALVLAEVLEHKIALEVLKEKSLADIGVESWAFTAFLARLEDAFHFQWDFDAAAEVFMSSATIAEHIRGTVSAAPDRKEQA